MEDTVVKPLVLYSSDSYELTVQPTQPLFQLHASTIMSLTGSLRIERYLKSSLLLMLPSVHELKIVLYAWLSAFDLAMADNVNAIVAKYVEFVTNATSESQTPVESVGDKKLN